MLSDYRVRDDDYSFFPEVNICYTYTRALSKTKARFPLPELTAPVNGPSWWLTGFHYITRQHGPCWRVRVSTSRVDGPCWRLVNSASGKSPRWGISGLEVWKLYYWRPGVEPAIFWSRVRRTYGSTVLSSCRADALTVGKISCCCNVGGRVC